MKNKERKGITLIALVITIIILLIISGIAIAMLSGENGLLEKIRQAKKTHIQSEMQEQLSLSLNELQVDKKGNASLDDVTQEWISSVISKDYNPTIKDDASIDGKSVIMNKNKITGKFLVNKNLQISKSEYNSDSLEFEYETNSRNGNNIEIVIKVRDSVNGLKQIDFPNGTNKIIENNKRDYISINYTVELGKEYKFIITTGDDKKTEKTIKIDNYYYSIKKTLGEGVSIDNKESKVAYNTEYNAKITVQKGYKINSITVKMGEEEINVDKITGIINITNVTGNIEIIVITEKIEYFEATEYPILTEKGICNAKNENGEYIYSSNAVCTAEDSIGKEAYDKDESTKVHVANKLVQVDKNMDGKLVEIIFEAVYASSYNVVFLDENKTEISSSNITNTKLREQLEIPSATKWITFKFITGDSWGATHGELYEISIYEEPIITVENIDYPEITETTVNTPPAYATIKYYQTSVKKLYKIDDGEWMEYKDSPVKLNKDEKIYAKAIKANGSQTKEIVAEYKIKDDAVNYLAYDNNTSTYDNVRGKMMKIGANVKKINLNFTANYASKYYITFLDDNKKEISYIDVTNSNYNGNINVPENSKWITWKYITGNGAYGNLYEIKAVNE